MLWHVSIFNYKRFKTTEPSRPNNRITQLLKQVTIYVADIIHYEHVNCWWCWVFISRIYRLDCFWLNFQFETIVAYCDRAELDLATSINRYKNSLKKSQPTRSQIFVKALNKLFCSAFIWNERNCESHCQLSLMASRRPIWFIFISRFFSFHWIFLAGFFRLFFHRSKENVGGENYLIIKNLMRSHVHVFVMTVRKLTQKSYAPYSRRWKWQQNDDHEGDHGMLFNLRYINI